MPCNLRIESGVAELTRPTIFRNMQTLTFSPLIRFSAFALLFSIGPLLKASEKALPEIVEELSVSIEDIKGREVKPFELDDAKASALIFVTQDCPISNAYAPEMARLKSEYESRGFKLTLVYVDPDVSRADIESHMDDYSLAGYTAIADRRHRLVRATGATVTPEAVVVLPDGAIAYRGRIDNMYPALGNRRRVITERDLRSALNSIDSGKEIPVARTRTVGCYIPNL